MPMAIGRARARSLARHADCNNPLSAPIAAPRERARVDRAKVQKVPSSRRLRAAHAVSLVMSHAHHAPIHPSDVLRTVVKHPWRWGLPLVVCTALGMVAAAFRPISWEATQAMLVRD